MNAEIIIPICQLVVTLMAFGGLVFAMGRLTERVAGIHQSQQEIKAALFGDSGDGGGFVRHSEMEVLLLKATGEHAEFDRRLAEQAGLIGELRAKLDR